MKLLILIIFAFLPLISSFTIHSASSCVAKKLNLTPLNISSKSDFTLQSDGLLCGEDDFIVSQLDHVKFLTVVDGVGSWKHEGINPKFFVTEFIGVLSQKFQALSYEKLKSHDVKNFLADLVGDSLNFLINAKNKAEVNIGSCTIASMTINLKTLQANVYHLGDAGYLVIRDSKVILKSKDMVKRFNLPFQLGIPDKLSIVDNPKLGKSTKIKLEVGDVIIIGSDGLLDNIFPDHMADVVRKQFYKKKGINLLEAAQRIAKVLTIEAKEIGESDLKYWTPFAKDFREYFKKKFGGGKNDDTTVVVGIIGE